MTDRRPLSPAKSLKLPMEVPRAWSWLIDLIFRRFFIKVDIMNLLVSVSWRCHGRIFERARILREGSYCQWASMGKSTKKKAVQRKDRDYPSKKGVSPNHQSLGRDGLEDLWGWSEPASRMRMNPQNPMPCIFRVYFSVILSVSFIYFHQSATAAPPLEAITKSPRCSQLPQPYYFLHSPYH